MSPEEEIKDLLSKFDCNVCNAKFKYKHHLKRHVETIHEEKKPLRCEFCSNSFGQSNNLKHVQHLCKYYDWSNSNCMSPLRC